jgi:dolichyl-phosphate-mannose-protein mannosyltransferase
MSKKRLTPQEPVAPRVPIGRRTFAVLLGVVLLFSLATKLIRLGIPADLYFDEHYHAYTAVHYLQGDQDAYNPWGKNPSGSAIEWTHPPLAKLVMAGMMIPFGQNSFGWRVGSVIFGTLSILLAAFVALALFDSPFIALVSAALMSVEGVIFVSSRIGMNDIYFIAFELFSVLFYIHWKKTRSTKDLFLLGTGLGLAAATKWTTLYLFVILGVDLTREYFHRDYFRKPFPWGKMGAALVALPGFLYLFSYLHFFLTGGGVDSFITLQQQMWWYHSGLSADHQYKSLPWQWLLNLRPIWMYAGSAAPGETANIYNIGNSVVLLSGLVAVYWLLFKEKKKTWSRWFVLLCYFLLWLPWVFSPRIMFSYHYGPAIPFLCMILAWFLEGLVVQRSTKGLACAIGIGCAALIWFAVFYPHMTAIPVSQSFADHVYYAIPGWK